MSDCTDVDAAPRPVTGPRVARLARQLEAAADAEARDALTEAFWAEAARTGTPLVEELDDAPGHRAVTFLWRGHRATRRVLLMAPGITDPERLAGSLLHHLPGTDVWYLGRRLRADHRGSYRMVADISAGPAPADPALLQRRLLALRAHGGADPLNPARIPVRWRDAQDSVFALPDAPPQPWSARRPAVARGGVERHTVAAGVLGAARDVWVYLPPDALPYRPAYEPGEEGRLPLLVLCDGDMWFDRLGLQDTLDALIADGVLPPLAVLAPDAVGTATRRLELGGRESYVSFLADEVVPWASARWPLTARADRTVVAGQGLGGMTALYAGLTRPERFGAVVAQSPSLWWRPGLEPGAVAPDAVGTPWLATLAAGLRDGPPGGARGAAVHFDVGLHEGALAEHTEALQAVLRARGHRVTRNLHNGGHDYACWRGFLADALMELVGTGLDVNAAESQGGAGPAGRSAVCSAGLPGRPAAR
ncbi:enterochelin esterase [Streptomyces cyaneofuscatus]|uniref:enterochelin esterase n=1 Tax=Streptomyces cyaneofuscatus TaxID=66883 RepID=UPI0013DAA332|nr:enterochelin esterase [Streptomyces cyaneofuscatus]NDZ67603.1 enterochelin esterase [Streptomyces cyaneofuscatus]